jgi:N-acetylmuramoyl-L-alanine amidase
VVIDPGHNGANGAHTAEINRQVDIGTKVKECDTTGTASADGTSESSFTWDVSRRIQDQLEALGATVVLTRPDDAGWGPCIDERAAIGNRAGADLSISIHADGGPATGRGFHVIHPSAIPGLTDDIAVASETLAVILRDIYATTTGIPTADYLGAGGLSRRDDLGGLNLSDVPKVFLETGNMRNVDDVAVLNSEPGRATIARAVVEAVTRYLSAGSEP